MSICPRCGDEFEQSLGVGQWRKYCRPDCDHVQHSCAHCGTDFTAPPVQQFCSRRCNLASINSDAVHQRHAASKAVLVLKAMRRGTAKPTTYLKEDQRHAHRVAAEKALGRALGDSEVVHHEDLDKHNNDPANLIVFPDQAGHARHHKLDHLGKLCACRCIRLGGDA